MRVTDNPEVEVRDFCVPNKATNEPSKVHFIDNPEVEVQHGRHGRVVFWDVVEDVVDGGDCWLVRSEASWPVTGTCGWHAAVTLVRQRAAWAAFIVTSPMHPIAASTHLAQPL